MTPWRSNQSHQSEQALFALSPGCDYHQAANDVRRMRTTLYIITACYVIIGFVIAIPAALGGDRVSTFLGFLIIGGALGVAAGVNIVLKSIGRLAIIEDQLAQVAGYIHSLEECLRQPPIDAHTHNEDAAELQGVLPLGINCSRQGRPRLDAVNTRSFTTPRQIV